MQPKGTAIYIDIKAGIPFTVLQQKYNLNTLASYYVVKAHAHANEKHFFDYWNNGQTKDPLHDVLSALYSEHSLAYCHPLANALPEVHNYLVFAKQIL